MSLNKKTQYFEIYCGGNGSRLRCGVLESQEILSKTNETKKNVRMCLTSTT